MYLGGLWESVPQIGPKEGGISNLPQNSAEDLKKHGNLGQIWIFRIRTQKYRNLAWFAYAHF